ncbi:MAG TPA: hypothetical protein VFC82_02980 [Actinomycetaceae bacterium]|nr:hypothetical protein [Actinomycetaceae bacterium]
MTASDFVCSARGCRKSAEYALVWRNPRIHDASRRKVWLACEEHGGHLHEYLASRGFPVDAMPIDELDDSLTPPGGGNPPSPAGEVT